MTHIAFQYKAMDRLGAMTKGVIHAADADDAYRRLSAAGMEPLRIRKSGSLFSFGARASLRDLAHLTYQLSVLMEARIPIADGLRSIADQESNQKLAGILFDISARIEGGCTVTDAIAAYGDTFGDVYVETVRAAEATGNMTSVLGMLAEMLERQYAVLKSVRSALLYPICVAVSLVLATAALLTFVVPRFTSMYARKGVDLPFLTDLLIFVSAACRGYWWLMILVTVASVLGLRAAWRNRRSREGIDAMLNRVPRVKELLRGVATGRFAQVLGISLHSGLGLIEALEMSGSASGRPLLELETEKMRTHVNHGGRLTDVMVTCPYLPSFARRMLAAGEEAGDLPRMCAIVARHYERETEHLARGLTTLVEPILIAGLAGIVLVIALGIFLPMWNMAGIVG